MEESIVIQNRRISQSETQTICDVVNIMSLQRVRVSGDQNVTLLLDYGYIWIYPNE